MTCADGFHKLMNNIYNVIGLKPVTNLYIGSVQHYTKSQMGTIFLSDNLRVRVRTPKASD